MSRCEPGFSPWVTSRDVLVGPQRIMRQSERFQNFGTFGPDLPMATA
jgi:hypothetical protein